MLNKKYTNFIVSSAIYAGFAVYLYQPYFENFKGLQYLIVANVCLASLGCFVMSRRWVPSFTASFFAGAVYGFGPFLLGLAKFHPTAGLLAATIPWLFCPAAFWSGTKQRWKSAILSSLPFLAIAMFFIISTHFHVFPVPTQTRLELQDLAGFLAPLVMVKKTTTLFSFYHIPIAPLVVGLLMLLKARRLGIMIIFCLGMIPAFCKPFLGISPIIWITIPALCCAVLIGEGMQGLVLAGPTDKKWLLLTTTVMVVASLATLLLATKCFQIFAGLGVGYAKLFVDTAKIYIVGAVATAVIFLMAYAKMRILWLRWVILGAAMAVDIFLGARFIVDRSL